MRRTIGFEPWRIGLIVAGLSLAFAGALTLGGPPGSPRSVWHEFAPAGAAVVGLLVVLAGLFGRQTASSGEAPGSILTIGSNLTIGLYLLLPLLSYVGNLSPEWKVILGVWAVAGIVMAAVIARRRA
jgi:hypothetical protein